MCAAIFLYLAGTLLLIASPHSQSLKLTNGTYLVASKCDFPAGFQDMLFLHFNNFYFCTGFLGTFCCLLSELIVSTCSTVINDCLFCLHRLNFRYRLQPLCHHICKRS